MEINENNFRVVMLKGAKGDTYDDTQLRQDIDEKLANAPYVLYSEDDGFQLPIYTLNDDTISAYSTWSSEKIKAEYPEITYRITNDEVICDKTFQEIRDIYRDVKIAKINVIYNLEIIEATFIKTVSPQATTPFIINAKSTNSTILISHTPTDEITYTIKPDSYGFGNVINNWISGHIQRSELEDYSGFNVLLGRVRPDVEPELYNYLSRLDAYLEGHISQYDVPYTMRYDETTLGDETDRHDVEAMEFKFVKLKITKDENNNYLLYLKWYYKRDSLVSGHLLNGVYISVYPFFRPLPNNA